MSRRLQGENAVVTGSSRGIGRAIAVALAAEGARVVINGSGTGPQGPGADTKSLDDAVNEIEAKGGTAIASCGSVADFTYAGRLVMTCVDSFGRIDILVNCAGVADAGTILDVPLEAWHRAIDVHLNGTFNCCRHAAPLMVQQKSGRIVNTGSHAFLGMYGGNAYPAAKGGIISLTKAMAVDLKGSGVTCNAFCPGAKTRLSTGADYQERIRTLHAKGCLTKEYMEIALNPPDASLLAPLVVYLASNESAHINGRVFSVFGGYIGLFPEPAEVMLGYKDPDTQGLWTIDEIAKCMPAK
jgi:3-oxoacyl-[acyl-carrier protein] reductase